MSPAIAQLKTLNQDFLVEEVLGFSLSDEGEHIWLFIEKDGLNTKDVIRELSRFTGLKQSDIGYSGLKDKHAITRQWFSLYYPGKVDIDFSCFDAKQIKILQIGYENLAQVHALIDGKINLTPKDKGFLLSVMRSFLFNAYAEFREQQHTEQAALVGDIVGFTDGNTVFQVTKENQAEVQERVNAKELSIAAPLIGKPQKLFFSDAALSKYIEFCREHHKFIDYLEAHTEMQFRSMYAFPHNLSDDYDQTHNTLTLDFQLPTGAYATSLISALG